MNSRGVAPKDVRSILAQDRADDHRFRKRDPQDQKEFTFLTPENRALFQKARIVVSPKLKKKIRSGVTVDLSVFVLRKDLIELKEGLIDPNLS